MANFRAVYTKMFIILICLMQNILQSKWSFPFKNFKTIKKLILNHVLPNTWDIHCWRIPVTPDKLPWRIIAIHLTEKSFNYSQICDSPEAPAKMFTCGQPKSYSPGTTKQMRNYLTPLAVKSALESKSELESDLFTGDASAWQSFTSKKGS